MFFNESGVIVVTQSHQNRFCTQNCLVEAHGWICNTLLHSHFLVGEFRIHITLIHI